MNTFLALIRREVWEHSAIWRVPAVMSALFVVMAVFASGKLIIGGLSVAHLLDQSLDADQVAHGLGTFNLAVMGLFFLVMGAVTIFYLLDCLLADRKDRSILFWKSLPISDLITVLSKLATGAVLIPVMALIAGFVTALMLLVILSVDVLLVGGSPWNLLWASNPLFTNVLLILYATVVQVLWYLPLMGYLMLVSAFAKRAVMLWAVLPPLVITVLEKQFFDSDYFARLIADRLSGVMPLAFDAGVGGRWGVDAGKDLVIRSPGLEVINPGPLLTSPGLWLGLLVAAAFLAGAVYLRRYRDESI